LTSFFGEEIFEEYPKTRSSEESKQKRKKRSEEEYVSFTDTLYSFEY